MKNAASRRSPRWILMLAAAIPAAVLSLAAAPPESPTPSAPDVSPTNPVPDSVLTPGSGTQANERTPGPGGDLYSLPKSTPVGMPRYSITSGPSGTGAPPTASRPRAAADCRDGAWSRWSLGFTSQAGCETWLRRHAVTTSGAAGMVTAGRSAVTRATTPAGSTTPGASITPRPRRTFRAKRPLDRTPAPATTPTPAPPAANR